MSQWAREHPEEMAEIAALPPSQQNAAMRDAIGYDPDLIREQAEEDAAAPEHGRGGPGLTEPYRGASKPCWRCGGDGCEPWKGQDCSACGGTGIEP
jgi:hypothetical protein